MKLHQWLKYDDQTGDLIWLPRVREDFKSQGAYRAFISRCEGKIAGCPSSKSSGGAQFISVKLLGKPTLAHRIIWEMHNGPIPVDMLIDHIDGNPWNNRLSNLRLATQSQNLRNRGTIRANRYGLKGVSMTPTNKYAAYIKVNYKKLHLGTFDTKGVAALVYAKASLRLHGKYSYFAR